MNLKKAFKRFADYIFQPTTVIIPPPYKYEVIPARPATAPKGLKAFFDLSSQYNNGKTAAIDIMKLANEAGEAKGHFVPGTEAYGFTFKEEGFAVSLQPTGQLMMDCSAAFAEKAKTLPSVKKVTEMMPIVPMPAGHFRY